MDTVIDATGLTKNFGDVKALDSVDLELRAGSILD